MTSLRFKRTEATLAHAAAERSAIMIKTLFKAPPDAAAESSLNSPSADAPSEEKAVLAPLFSMLGGIAGARPVPLSPVCSGPGARLKSAAREAGESRPEIKIKHETKTAKYPFRRIAAPPLHIIITAYQIIIVQAFIKVKKNL